MIDPKQIDPNKLNAQESGQTNPPPVPDSSTQDLGTKTPNLNSNQTRSRDSLVDVPA